MNEKSAVEDICFLIRNKVKKQWVIAFVSCVIIGVLTYGYFMTNHFLTYDSMWNLFSNQDMISSGRQFLMYACSISSYYDFPFLNGILAILYLAATAVLLVELFRIKNGICAVFVSGLLVTFPSVISTFCYSFTVDGYMLAVLMVTAALLITERKKFGFVVGAILLGISLGIYQAYLGFLMVLCLIMLLLQLLEERELKKVLGKVMRYAAMGIGGYVFYLMTLNAMLALKGQTLSGYQGSDKVFDFSLKTIPLGIWTAYKNFFGFLVNGKIVTVTDMMTIAVAVLIFAGVILYLALFFKNKCYKKLWVVIMTALFVMCLPVCGSIISVLSPDTYYHTLMWNAWCLPFIFVIVLVERIAKYRTAKEGRIKKAAAAVVFVSSAVLIFEFMKVANLVGYSMEERYEKNYAISLRIVESLEEIPEYRHGMKVAILGGEPNQSVFPPTDVATVPILGYFGSYGNYSLNSSVGYASFMAHYLNVSISTISLEEEQELMQTQEFEEMPYFPYNGSIRQIGDIWVVKLNG